MKNTSTSRTEKLLERHGLGRNVPRTIRRAVRHRLRALEADPEQFEREAIRLRQRLKKLYAVLHVAPAPLAQEVLFGATHRGAVGAVGELARLASAQTSRELDRAATLVREHALPFVVVESTFATLPEPVALALVETMSEAELVVRIVSLFRRGALSSRVRQALKRRLEAATIQLPYHRLESVVRRANLDPELAALLIARSAARPRDGLDGAWAVLVDASLSVAREADGALLLGASVASSVDQALDTAGTLEVISYGARAVSVPWARGASPTEARARLAGAPSDLGVGTSLGVALEVMDDSVRNVAVVTDGTENRPPRAAQVLLARRARLARDVSLTLVVPHDGSTQLTVDLARAAVPHRVFQMDRFGFGREALLGALAGVRGEDLVDEILATAPA